MRLYWQAFKDLFLRYVQIWKLVWKEREILKFPHRSDLERQFLPAAMELEETPVSPSPRLSIAIISGFVIIACLWSIFGKLDVVVSANGKIVPDTRTKIVQSAESAVVKAIYVKDGDWVKAGDVLIELDNTITQADALRTLGEWSSSSLAALRARAFLNWMKDAQVSRAMEFFPQNLSKVDPQLLQNEKSVYWSQVQEYMTNLDKADSEIAARVAELEYEKQILQKQEETLPIINQRAQEYAKLQDSGYVSRHEFLDHQKESIELTRQVQAQKNKVIQLQSLLAQQQTLKRALTDQVRRQMNELLSENQQKSGSLNQEKIKAQRRETLTRLTAPVSGKVQQLSVHTVGGVVTPAQALLVLVPSENDIEIEAMIQNKDIGFVQEGQSAVVKVEAFSFTKYGTIAAKVQTISLDAVQEKELGLFYVARVSLAQNYIRIENKKVPLTPGMAVQVEIKTGKRRVIEYFLSPLLKESSQSLRER